MILLLLHFEEKEFIIIIVNFHCIMLQSYQKMMYLLSVSYQFIFPEMSRRILNDDIKGKGLTQVNFFSRKQIKL